MSRLNAPPAAVGRHGRIATPRGARLKILRVHMRKFRRTVATNAIDKDMPIGQLQQLLGHGRIDTTL